MGWDERDGDGTGDGVCYRIEDGTRDGMRDGVWRIEMGWEMGCEMGSDGVGDGMRCDGAAYISSVAYPSSHPKGKFSGRHPPHCPSDLLPCGLRLEGANAKRMVLSP